MSKYTEGYFTKLYCQLQYLKSSNKKNESSQLTKGLYIIYQFQRSKCFLLCRLFHLNEAIQSCP